MEDGVSDKEHEPERGDGDGMVMEVMVGVPEGGQFIKALILDTPALVAEDHDMAGGDFVLG